MYITSQPPSSGPTVDDYLNVATSRRQVLGTIREWLSIGGGAQDILDDAQLYSAIRIFLDNAMDHGVVESDHFANPMVRQAWDGLEEARQSLGSFFISQTMRPRLSRTNQPHHMRVGAKLRSHGGREPPDIDRIDPEDLVESLDGMMAATFGNVTEEVGSVRQCSLTRSNLHPFVNRIYMSWQTCWRFKPPIALVGSLNEKPRLLKTMSRFSRCIHICRRSSHRPLSLNSGMTAFIGCYPLVSVAAYEHMR